MDIQTRSQPDGNTDLQHFPTHSLSDLFNQFGIPGLGLHRFAGPCRHIAVDGSTFSGFAFQQWPDLLQPPPLPIRRQTIRIPGCTIPHHRGGLIHIQTGGAVCQYNIGNAFPKQLCAGAACRAHHIVIATDRVAAANHQLDLVLFTELFQKCFYFA